MVLITRNIDLSKVTYPANALKSKDPLRSILLSNLSAANITFYLGEATGTASDAFTVPPSTDWDIDIFDLWDEDYHEVVLTTGPATGFVNVQYKASINVPAFFGPLKSPRGNYSG
jgi:hypothetical protein